VLLLAQAEPHSTSFSNNTHLNLNSLSNYLTSNQTTLQQQEQVSFHLNYVGMIEFFNFLGLVFCLNFVFYFARYDTMLHANDLYCLII